MQKALFYLFFFFQQIFDLNNMKLIKHLTLLLFIGLAWGQENLLIKKAESSIKFNSGQKLIIRYNNVESNVVFKIEGEFKNVRDDFLMINTICLEGTWIH